MWVDYTVVTVKSTLYYESADYLYPKPKNSQKLVFFPYLNLLGNQKNKIKCRNYGSRTNWLHPWIYKTLNFQFLSMTFPKSSFSRHILLLPPETERNRHNDVVPEFSCKQVFLKFQTVIAVSSSVAWFEWYVSDKLSTILIVWPMLIIATAVHFMVKIFSINQLFKQDILWIILSILRLG